MAKILQYIENIYSGIDLPSTESKYIYNPANFKLETGFKNYSRFPTSGNLSEHKPYIIDDDLITKLNDHIKLIPNLWNLTFEDFDDHIIINNDTSLCMYEPMYLDSMTYLGEFTALGLLAIRCQKYFGNELFKLKVENKLSTFRNRITIGEEDFYVPIHINEFITNVLINQKNPIKDDQLRDYLRTNSFYWRDAN